MMRSAGESLPGGLAGGELDVWSGEELEAAGRAAGAGRASRYSRSATATRLLKERPREAA